MATVSAGLKGEVGRFPLGALLMLVLGFAVRTEAGLRHQRLAATALGLGLGRRSTLGLHLVGFSVGAPVDVAWCKSCQKKGAMRGRTALR